MNLLIIGGTAFVGRAIAEYALEQGYEVSLFHRGKTNTDIFPAAQHLFGDRDGDLDALTDGKWNAVIDTCGYVPRIVGLSAKKLQDNVAHYTFISTISVYDKLTETYGIDENSPLATLEDESTEAITGETYGGLKVLCEKVVQEYYPKSHTIVRPGLIVGPHDYTHRYAYWVLRMAQGGEMLAPGNPDQVMQVIDARDLAKFTVDLTVKKMTGIYNATNHGVPLRKTLAVSQAVTQADSQITWVDEDFLIEQEVQPSMNFPLWLPSRDSGIHSVNVSKGISAGLSFRPIEETIADNYAWLQAEAQKPDTKLQVAKGILSAEREAEILAAWHNR